MTALPGPAWWTHLPPFSRHECPRFAHPQVNRKSCPNRSKMEKLAWGLLRKLAREHPEELIERTELGSGVPALQDGELLSKRQILKEQTLA